MGFEETCDDGYVTMGGYWFSTLRSQFYTEVDWQNSEWIQLFINMTCAFRAAGIDKGFPNFFARRSHTL